MGIYQKIYYNLCERGSQRKNEYRYSSGLHKHHIIPTHSGGEDVDLNVTYLSVREHIIAHFLLYKINKNINDLRSMKMLGANLSVEYRCKIGKWCVENKIGMFGASDEQKREWIEQQRHIRRNNGYNSMKNKTGFYGISKEKRKETNKKSIQTQKDQYENEGIKNFYYWSTPEGRKERSSNGAKCHIGKKSMYKPGESSFKRVSSDKIQEFLNNGYVFGTNNHKKAGKKTGPNIKKRKKVTDGITIYSSVTEASKKLNLTPGAICYRCSSKKNINWKYVS